MAIIGGVIADWILGFYPYHPGSAVPYEGRSKLETLFGPRVWDEFLGKTVIDFGCGDGVECAEIASRGAVAVVGLEVRDKVIERARESTRHLSNVIISKDTSDKADVILSLDSFEHFGDPAAVLRNMRALLKPRGYVLASFGPIWGHPLGGHMFSVFPWAHLIFTEASLMRWHSRFYSGGYRRFIELPEPLNRMTIRRFKHLVNESPLQIVTLRAVPIRPVRHLHNRLTAEFFTSVVQCRLGIREEINSGSDI
jgi:SAM-dependent methyltransferase